MAKKKAKVSKKPTLSEINRKLDILIKGQEEIIEKEAEIEKEEKKTEALQKKEVSEEAIVEKEEEKELSELEKLEKLEEEVKKQVVPHPLKTITYKDVARGSIGALFGAVAHYTFLYGIEVAHKLTFFKAILVFVLSLVVGGVFLYATGFRKIKDPKVIIFLPVRLFVLYATAVVMSVIVLWFFEPGFGSIFEESFKQVSTITLLAVIGACTADILGRE